MKRLRSVFLSLLIIAGLCGFALAAHAAEVADSANGGAVTVNDEGSAPRLYISGLTDGTITKDPVHDLTVNVDADVEVTVKLNDIVIEENENGTYTIELIGQGENVINVAAVKAELKTTKTIKIIYQSTGYKPAGDTAVSDSKNEKNAKNIDAAVIKEKEDKGEPTEDSQLKHEDIVAQLQQNLEKMNAGGIPEEKISITLDKPFSAKASYSDYEIEPNNSFSVADYYALGTDKNSFIDMNGQLTYEDIDCYKIVLPTSGELLFAGVSSDYVNLAMSLYDQYGNMLAYSIKYYEEGVFINQELEAGTYYIAVLDFNDVYYGGDRSYSVGGYYLSYGDTTPPSSPTGVTATPGNGEINVTWNANRESDLDGYYVYESTSRYSGFTKLQFDAGNYMVTGTQVRIYNLDSGATRYYYITAVDESGNESSPSTTVWATVSDTTPPSPPTGVNAAPGNGEINVTWNANRESDLAGYYVYESTSRYSGFTKLQFDAGNYMVTGTQVRIYNLDSGATRYYYITAVDESGNESSPSTTVWATVSDTTPPSSPTGVTAAPGNGEVNISWNTNSETDLAGYYVYMSTNRYTGFTRLGSGMVTGTSGRHYNLTNGLTYYYYVTAVDKSGNESQPSTTVWAAPNSPGDTTPPAPPANVSAVPGDGEVDITWSANTERDLAGYYVYESTDPASGFDRIRIAGDEVVTITGIKLYGKTNGVTYYYYVTAVDNDANESGKSATVSVTPAGTVAPPPDDKQYRLWTGSTTTEGVPDNKEWRIKFNTELEPSTVTNTNLFICKSGTGERHPVVLTNSTDPDSGATTVILKPQEPYTASSYNLYINKSIKAKGNKATMKHGIKMPFTVCEKASGRYVVNDVILGLSKGIEITGLTGLDNAQYFNLFFNGVKQSTEPVSINDTLVCLPVAFYYPEKLELKFYSDADGATVVGTATLNDDGTLNISQVLDH